MQRLSVFCLVFLGLVLPAQGLELAGVPIRSITGVSAGPKERSPDEQCKPASDVFPEGLNQGETATLDVICALITFSVSGSEVLASVSSSPPEALSLSVWGLWFDVPPVNGVVTPIIIEHPLPSCKSTSLSEQPCADDFDNSGWLFGSIGGYYPMPEPSANSCGKDEPLRCTWFFIGGDEVSGPLVFHTLFPAGSSITPIPMMRISTVKQPTAPTECSDGVDNDGDGRIDLDDKQCESAVQTSESDPRR